MTKAPQYETLYTELRTRIERGEFAVGDRLPPISALQKQYGIHSLGTVRTAQQRLVEDGMIRTEQGRGAFVISTESARTINPDDALEGAIAQIRRAQAALARQRVRRVTFDLDAEDDTYYVLTDALTEWADIADFQAEESEPHLAESLRRHATHARDLLRMIEDALDGPTKSDAGGDRGGARGRS